MRPWGRSRGCAPDQEQQARSSRVSRLLVRILVTVGIVLAAVFVSVQWIAPIAFSFYAAKKASPVARIVPIDLKDKSVSKTPGEKLSYFGYDFELPWSDLDETQTKLYPTDSPKKSRVDLRFHSGLRLLVTAVPAREWINGLTEEMKVSPQRIESTFGSSDYPLVKAIYLPRTRCTAGAYLRGSMRGRNSF